MKIPSKILTSIVRTRFYSKIEWQRCDDLAPNILARELRAVIERIIDIQADDLSNGEKTQLISEILQEVREMDRDDLTNLHASLNSKASLPTQLLNWARDVAEQLSQWKYRKTKPPSPA